MTSRAPSASLRDLIARDPMDANALNSLGYMLAERGDRLDEAVTLLQRALKIEPGNPSYLDSLGWAYFQQGRLDLADPPLTEAAGKLKTNSVVQDHLGDLRFKQQRFADAAAAWERALAGDGQSIDRVEDREEDSRGSRPDVNRRIRLLPAARSASLRLPARRGSCPLPSGGGDATSPIMRRRYEQATQTCAACGRWRAVLSISGRADRQRLRAKIDAGFEAPSQRPTRAAGARASQSSPSSSTARRATLVLPRDGRVLRDAPPADTLEALAGVAHRARRSADDRRRLRASAAGDATRGRASTAAGWRSTSGSRDDVAAAGRGAVAAGGLDA